MAEDEKVEEKSLTVEKDALYMLRWRVPAVPQITIRFVNAPEEEGGEPDKQDFHFPDPPTEGATPTVVEITMKSGATEEEAEPARFRNKRARPVMATETIKVPGKKPKDPPTKVEVRVFSAVFKAREEGVCIFTTKGGPKTLVQKMTVTPATPVYRTIADVMNDEKALRRQAVLAAVADFYPAFNTCTRGDEAGPPKTAQVHKKAEASTHQAPNAKVGQPSGYMGQGNWASSYGFCSKTPGTSCTSTNPMVNNAAACPSPSDTKKCPDHKHHRYWAFDASSSAGWVVASRTKVPSVGDTYVLNNGWDMYTGHVGIVLHVPPDGNGLWVTADGGAGTKPSQLGLLNPRWGLMGAMLPLGGKDADRNKYPKMVPKDEDGPFLSGATGQDIDPSQPVPRRDDDVAGMIQRIYFRQTEKADAVSNPRRMAGYVNVDNENLRFKVDGLGKNEEHLKKCKDLETRVEALVTAYLAGGIMGGAGT